jgi:hypothetical protein
MNGENILSKNGVQPEQVMLHLVLSCTCILGEQIKSSKKQNCIFYIIFQQERSQIRNIRRACLSYVAGWCEMRTRCKVNLSVVGHLWLVITLMSLLLVTHSPTVVKFVLSIPYCFSDIIIRLFMETNSLWSYARGDLAEVATKKCHSSSRLRYDQGGSLSIICWSLLVDHLLVLCWSFGRLTSRSPLSTTTKKRAGCRMKMS